MNDENKLTNAATLSSAVQLGVGALTMVLGNEMSGSSKGVDLSQHVAEAFAAKLNAKLSKMKGRH